MKYLHLIIFALFMNLNHATAQERPDELPVYPGCEQEAQKMSCFKEHLLNFMVDHFDSDLLKKVKDTKQVSMFVSFVIDENGALDQVQIQSGYDYLNEEMKRVLSKVPVIQPAKKDGQPIPMRYELPVIFEVSK